MEFRDKLKFERELEEKKLKAPEEENKVDYSSKKIDKINLAVPGVKTNNAFVNKDFKFKFSAPGVNHPQTTQIVKPLNNNQIQSSISPNQIKNEDKGNINLIYL